MFIQSGLGNPDVIFPMRNRLKGVVKNSIDVIRFFMAPKSLSIKAQVKER